MELQYVPAEDTLNHTLIDTIFSTELAHLDRQLWMEKNWRLSFYYVLAYVLVIHGGQKVMKHRKPLDLKKAMIVWNFGLALFSIIGSIISVSDFAPRVLAPNGFHDSVCKLSTPFILIVSILVLQRQQVLVLLLTEDAFTKGFIKFFNQSQFRRYGPLFSYYAWLFGLSKVIELVDTFFIVLRKRPLIFLHWYHHVTVLLFTWYAWRDNISTSLWFICVNSCVHALMYSYFFVVALGVRVPKPVAMFITLSQLSQMVVGVWVNVYAHKVRGRGGNCDVSDLHLQWGFIMYASYFVLFAHFFYRAYMVKREDKKKGQ